MSDPKSNDLRFAFALTAVLCILIFSILSCTTKPGPANTIAKENLAVLENLGIKTDLGDLEDPNGNPLPADYNPLGKKYGVLNPTDEIYTAGYTVQVSTEVPPFTMDVHQCLFDDLGKFSKPLYWGNDSWTSSQFKNCIGADTDGDGFEEVVVVYYDVSAQTLNLKVIDNQDGHYDEYNKVILANITSTPSLSQYQPALAKGDFDKDNKDEIAVGFTNWVYVLDDKDSDYAVTSSHNYPDTSDLYLAAGDVDWDSQDELVVTYHYGGYAYCDLFDGDLSAPLLINQVALGNSFGNGMGIAYEQHVHVCVGDIDGDHYEEVVLYGECRNYSPGWVVTAMKYSTDTQNFEWMDFYFFTQRSDVAGTSSQPTLVILDYNGDGLKEIFASSNVYKIDPSANTTDFLYHGKVQYGIYTNPPVNVCAGDVDGDFKDELLCYQGYPSSGNLRIDGWDEATNGNLTQLTKSGTCGDTSKICLANVDNDSPIVEYTGQHELLFSYPTVIAVLACPPYHAGIGQNIGSCGTTFGMSTATGVEKTESTGFTVGFSVGYESEDPFGIAKSSFKVKVESAMDWISSKSNEIEKYVAYTSGPDEDKVIFTAIPFDVYYYTVISSPNPADVGNTLSINVPRDMQTLSVSRIFYNDRNGDNPDIDSQVLGHTIGNVWSYPSAAERNALLVNGGLCSSNPMTVGVGSGYETQGIRMSQGQGTGTYNNFSVTVESEFGLGGVIFGMSAGFHYGFEYKVTNTQSTFYEGKVGDISYANYSTGMSYSFGLFTYPFTFNKQTFTVVNYWVQ